MPGSSPSALVIRLDAIGDALALAPLLAALRARGIPTDLVLSPSNAGIFSTRAARRIVVAEFALRSGSRADRTAVAELGRSLANRNYTHVLVATEDPSGYRLARATRAPVRVGFNNGWGKPLKTLWSRAFLTYAVGRTAGLDARGPHECEVIFELGADLVGNREPTRDRAQLRPLVLESEPAPDDRVVLQVTDKWERLGIAFDEVVDLIRRVAAVGTLRLIGGAREAAYVRRIAAATELPVDVFGEIAAWTAAIAASRALVAPDSGAMHVAGMIGTPVVGVFPPTRDYRLQVARWSPWAAPHRIVRADAGWPTRAAAALAELGVSDTG
ncbi:MAG TPA: glycosyltransferase family 9 protein [Candidatus Tumulicola sp.]|jgi:ADP-heptose:LPS heptosyltransferase